MILGRRRGRVSHAASPFFPTTASPLTSSCRNRRPIFVSDCGWQSFRMDVAPGGNVRRVIVFGLVCAIASCGDSTAPSTEGLVLPDVRGVVVGNTLAALDHN